MVARSMLCFVIFLAAMLAWQAQRVPTPLETDAPASLFSAMRAMQTVEAIAQHPHPTGSVEARRVRDTLVGRLRALALHDVHVQHAAVAVERHRSGRALITGAHVENVVAVLPGTTPAVPAILLMAHYDTVPGSPGAADDSLGIAAILEAVRALREDVQRRHDVIVLLTDAEEVGLLGAHAFFEQHPLATRVGFVINLEARGSRGRAMMFETAVGNGSTVAAYAGAAPAPVANSLMGFVYRRMPNGTDFSVPAAQGIPGLNLAITGAQFDYHAATATPAHLDRGSVQHMGDELLAAVRGLMATPRLPEAEADRVYGDVLGLRLWHHRPAHGWLVVAAIVLPLAFVLWRQRRAWTWPALLRGALFGVWTLLATALVARTVFRVLGGGSAATLTENRELLARFAVFAVAEITALAAVVLFGAVVALRGQVRPLWLWLLPLLAAAVCSLSGGFDAVAWILAALVVVTGLISLRRTTPNDWALGLLGTGAIVALIAQACAPELLPVFGWPLVPLALALVLPASFALRSIVQAACATLAMAQLMHIGVQLFIGVGYGLPEVLALIAMLSAIVLAPQLAAGVLESRVIVFAGIPAVVAGVAMLWLVVGDGVSERHPRISQAFHLAAGADEELHWHAAALPNLDAWSRQALGSDARRDEAVAAPFFPQLWVAEVTPLQASPNRISLERVGGSFSLRLVPPPETRELRVRLHTQAPLGDVRIEGIAVPMFGDGSHEAQLRWQAPPADGLELRFESKAASGRLAVDVAAFIDRWPEGGASLPPRDPRTMPWGFSDGQLRLDRREIGW